MNGRLLLIIGIAMTISGSTVAQTYNRDAWKDKGLKSPRQDMFIVTPTLERLMNLPNGVEQRFFSRGIAVNLMYDFIFNKSNFSLGVGGAISSQSVFLDAVLNKDSAAGPTYFIDIPPNTNYDKNKMVTTFVELPIELRFRTKANSKGHSWKFAITGSVGTLLDVHSKYVDASGKYKDFIFPDVENLRLTAGIKAGYGRVSLNYQRSFNTYLADGFGRRMFQYHVGLNISIF